MESGEQPPNDRFDQAPISQIIGFEVEPGDGGSAVLHLAVDQRFHNPMSRVHGGIISLLADAATGIAFGRTLEPHQEFATIDLHVQFMRPIGKGRLTARADVIQRGLRIGFVQCQISDERQRLIALATCTCTVTDLPPSPAIAGGSQRR